MITRLSSMKWIQNTKVSKKKVQSLQYKKVNAKIKGQNHEDLLFLSGFCIKTVCIPKQHFQYCNLSLETNITV